MKTEYCCDTMKFFVEQRCSIHSNPFDCPDIIIFYTEKADEYGIIIHDGGESYVQIKYCPWCGIELLDTKHEQRSE